MERDHAHLLVDGRVQRRDVRIAQQYLGVGPDDVEVHQVQHPRHAVAAAHAHHRVHAIVGEHTVQAPRAGGVGAGEVAVDLAAAVRHDHLVAHGLDGFHHARILLLRLLQRAGNAHQADGIARA